jgi:hypothetical protein
MKKLRDIGNTLIVVEHDMETIKSADFVVEVGPGPGLHGGEIVAAGRIGDIVAADRSVTGFDVNWQNGKGLGLNVQTATSSGSAAPVTLASAEMVTDEPVIAQTGIPLQRQVFRLRHTPIQAGSETIRALSRTLVRNQDYTLNYQTGELRLLTTTIPTASGEPTLYASYSSLPVTAKRAGNSAMTATAMRVVNAVPYVVDAAPGLLSSLDLPVTVPSRVFG